MLHQPNRLLWRPSVREQQGLREQQGVARGERPSSRCRLRADCPCQSKLRRQTPAAVCMYEASRGAAHACGLLCYRAHRFRNPHPVCHPEPRSRYHPTVHSMIPCIQALPAAPAPTSEARSWLQDATTAAEQRNIELRTRSHLLSSVDPVPYGDTNGPTHAPAVVSIAPSAAAVPAPSLGPWRIVRCIVARFIHYALLHANSGQPILVTHATVQPVIVN